MATKLSLLRSLTVISVLIIHPLLITSHALLRKRSDDGNNSQKFAAQDEHELDDYESIKILSKLLPSHNNITVSSSSTTTSPMACTPQETKLKKCYQSLPQPFNEIKCTQCIYGDVNPSTQVITCPHSNYCGTVSGCVEGTCPKDCQDEFYEVLNCVWEKAGCSKSAGVGDGNCGATVKKKKKVVTDPATASSKKESNNPCSECSTSKGGARHNFCGNLNVYPIQDVCSSQTECSNHGLKCQVCTKIVHNDGYGGKSVDEDIGYGAYICVKDENDGEDGNVKAAPAGRGGYDTTASAAAGAADVAISSSALSNNKTKKQKGADSTAATSTSSTTKKKQKGAKRITSSKSATTPAGGFCYSRAGVLGNCMFSKDTSPNCLKCIQSGTQDHTPDPSCNDVQQPQFCNNIATCVKEHCGECKFEFYAGLNCALQKIHGCEQFSCAIGGSGIEGAIGVSSGSGWYDGSDDGYTLQQFREDVERQYMTNPRREGEVVVREA